MTPSKNAAIQTALLGNWAKASALNKALLHADPKDIDALNRLAFAFTALGKIKEAKTMYRRVLKIDTLNPIALRNMKRLSELSMKGIKKDSLPQFTNHTFLEETGKTKTIELINIAQPKITSWLRTGQALNISIKRSKIFIQDLQDQYIGVLPDDIGQRLIKFIKGGNVYEACIKSANQHNVIIFIKEVKRASRFKNYPSFQQIGSANLNLAKNKFKNKNEPSPTLDEDEKNYLPDES